MSRLKELLDELCPDGVEYKELGSIAKVVRGASPRPIRNFLTNDVNGVNWIKIGDVEPGDKYITRTKEKITKEGAKKSRLVKVGDFILSNSMSFGRPYILKIEGCIHDGWLSISKFENNVIADYLYYVLMSTPIQNEMKKRASFGGAVQNLNADIVKAIRIPVPPLAVQCEIVRLLDNFAELTAELTAELSLRRTQYEHYRDTLLTFPAADEAETLSTSSVRWLSLEECIISLNTGLNPRKFFRLNTDDAKNYYITIREIHDGNIIPNEKTDRINDEALALCNHRSNLEKGDVLFSGTGTIGETAIVKETPTNWNIKEGVYTIKPNPQILSSRYLRYLLESSPIKKVYMTKAVGGTVKSVPMKELRKIKIPVPSMEAQERISSLVEKFDLLRADMTAGLPAEIDARRKQYAYYRDRLLTFREKRA